MATKRLLAQLALAHSKESGVAVAFESVGGVDAVRRLESGEACEWAPVSRSRMKAPAFAASGE